jgi:hypothetical protein
MQICSIFWASSVAFRRPVGCVTARMRVLDKQNRIQHQHQLQGVVFSVKQCLFASKDRDSTTMLVCFERQRLDELQENFLFFYNEEIRTFCWICASSKLPVQQSYLSGDHLILYWSVCNLVEILPVCLHNLFVCFSSSVQSQFGGDSSSVLT